MKDAMSTNTSPKRERVSRCVRGFGFTRLLNNAHLARFGFVLFVLSFALQASHVSAQDEDRLSWEFSKSDTLAVEFQQTQSVLTRIDARDRTLESEIVLGVDWNVTDVAGDGNATIEQTIERIRIKSGAPGAAIKKYVNVDTASDTPLRGISRDVMKQVKTLIGLKFIVVMTPAGEVVSVAPGSNVAAVVAALPDVSALRRVFSANAMAKLVSDSLFVLPQKSVAEGAVWNKKTTIAMTANDGRTFSFDRDVKSTLRNIDDAKASIDVEIALTQTPFVGTNSGSELTSPLELTGFTGSGQVEFDRSTGTLTSSTITSETKTLVVYREDKVKTTTKVTNQMTVVRK